MRLFSHIFTTPAQLGTQILLKKQKEDTIYAKNKCIRFWHKTQHISLTEFRSINWLPTKERVHQCINATTFKFVNKNCLFYPNEIFKFTPHCRIDTRIVLQSLSTVFARLTRGRKPYRTLVLLCGTIYPKPFKKGII